MESRDTSEGRVDEHAEEPVEQPGTESGSEEGPSEEGGGSESGGSEGGGSEPGSAEPPERAESEPQAEDKARDSINKAFE